MPCRASLYCFFKSRNDDETKLEINFFRRVQFPIAYRKSLLLLGSNERKKSIWRGERDLLDKRKSADKMSNNYGRLDFLTCVEQRIWSIDGGQNKCNCWTLDIDDDNHWFVSPLSAGRQRNDNSFPQVPFFWNWKIWEKLATKLRSQGGSKANLSTNRSALEVSFKNFSQEEERKRPFTLRHLDPKITFLNGS